jgi:hypothetical protein
MHLNKNTKEFLLHVLREDISGGGGVGTSANYGLNIPDYDPSNTGIDPITGKPKKKKKQSESEYYKDALQMALGGDVDLDKETSGQPSLGFLGALGTVKRRLGYKPNSGDATAMRGSNSLIKGAISGIAGGGLASTALAFMGPLGQHLSGKLPYLTAMGVDPLDYATKVMGVDYVSDELSKLGKRQSSQITSGGGYFKQ